MRQRIGRRDSAFAIGGFVAAFVLVIGLALAFPSDDVSPDNFPCHETEALLFVPGQWDKTQCVSLMDWPTTAPVPYLQHQEDAPSVVLDTEA